MPLSDLIRRLHRAVGVTALIGLAAPALAGDSGDPTWPCIQRRVDHLSVAALWPGDRAGVDAPVPDDARPLVEALSLRRVDEADAATRVTDYAAAHPDLAPEAYAAIFAEVVDRLDLQRGRVIAGIERYAAGQTEATAALDTLRAEMTALEAAADPDYDRMDAVEEEIDWRTRIFTDRARALTYVCETPVLIEQRAFAIGRMLAGAAEGDG